MAKTTTKTAHESNTSRPVESYGTSKEAIVATLENVTVRDVFGIDLNDKVVVAKDKDGKLYATSKSIAGSGLLDPYKLYHRVDVEEVNGEYKFIKSC